MRRRGMPAAHATIPNLAPMVDVVMVILIFFMLGTQFAVSEGALPTQLPGQLGPGGGARVAIVPLVQIALMEGDEGRGCRIVVMDREISENSFEALGALLMEKRAAGAHPSAGILIGAEPGVKYQDVISAMDACVRAGFTNIQFSVPEGAAARVEAGTSS